MKLAKVYHPDMQGSHVRNFSVKCFRNNFKNYKRLIPSSRLNWKGLNLQRKIYSECTSSSKRRRNKIVRIKREICTRLRRRWERTLRNGRGLCLQSMTKAVTMNSWKTDIRKPFINIQTLTIKIKTLGIVRTINNSSRAAVISTSKRKRSMTIRGMKTRTLMNQ